MGAVFPDETVHVVAQMIYHDDFFGTVAAQILKKEAIAAYSVLEVYFDE